MARHSFKKRRGPSGHARLTTAALRVTLLVLVYAMRCAARYFPVTFTPPPGDPHGITQALLARHLRVALCGGEAVRFGLLPFALPLLLEHLRAPGSAGGGGGGGGGGEDDAELVGPVAHRGRLEALHCVRMAAVHLAGVKAGLASSSSGGGGSSPPLHSVAALVPLLPSLAATLARLALADPHAAAPPGAPGAGGGGGGGSLAEQLASAPPWPHPDCDADADQNSGGGGGGGGGGEGSGGAEGSAAEAAAVACAARGGCAAWVGLLTLRAVGLGGTTGATTAAAGAGGANAASGAGKAAAAVAWRGFELTVAQRARADWQAFGQPLLEALAAELAVAPHALKGCAARRCLAAVGAGSPAGLGEVLAHALPPLLRALDPFGPFGEAHMAGVAARRRGGEAAEKAAKAGELVAEVAVAEVAEEEEEEEEDVAPALAPARWSGERRGAAEGVLELVLSAARGDGGHPGWAHPPRPTAALQLLALGPSSSSGVAHGRSGGLDLSGATSLRAADAIAPCVPLSLLL